jgi:aldose 1-epimerase
MTLSIKGILIRKENGSMENGKNKAMMRVVGRFAATATMTMALASASFGNKTETPGLKPSQAASVIETAFGKTPEGHAITLYTVTNGCGVEMKVMNYGAILVSLKTPDKKGVSEDIVLGFDSLSQYVKDKDFFGGTVGRFGNRVGGAKFILDGKTYNLTVNNGKNQLHGGSKGFYKAIWKGEKISSSDSAGVKFTYVSKDGEEGYPGNLSVSCTYMLNKKQEMTISFVATTDKSTPVNLTNHSYFNLSGDAKRDILGSELTIAADFYTPVDSTLIPTGAIMPVKATPMDFTVPMAIGSRIQKVSGGYDHNYVLAKSSNTLGLCARIWEPVSGRVMEIYSREPGIQFYSGNFLNGSIKGKAEKAYQKYFACCLEPQHFPDSPNKPHFPNTILNPGATYTNVMVYKFSSK